MIEKKQGGGRRQKKAAPPKPHRGRDNPRARKPISRAGGPMRLVSRMQVKRDKRPALLPGRRSRRPRQNVWVGR